MRSARQLPDTAEEPMQWLNEPVSWQRTADTVTVSVDPGTDFWRETGYGYIRDSGHVYGEVIAGDLDVSVRVRGTFSAPYDQAGVMLRIDDRVWLKSGLEFFEDRARLSTVLTLGRSSWIVTDLPEGTEEITLRAARRGDAVEIRYALADGPAELAALMFLPPGRELLAGVMCAAPEGPGFGVTFHDLHVAPHEPDSETRQGAPPAAADWPAQPDGAWDAETWSAATAGTGVTGWDPAATDPAIAGTGPGEPAAVQVAAAPDAEPAGEPGDAADEPSADGPEAPSDAADAAPPAAADGEDPELAPADEWISLLTADHAED